MSTLRSAVWISLPLLLLSAHLPAATPKTDLQGASKRVTIVKTTYKGWPNCYRVSNGRMELIATTDVGPRIIRVAHPDGPNEFKEFDGMIGQTGGADWKIYGGHRLWHSPEAKPRTYEPDNSPVETQVEGETLHLTQPTEATTGIQKEIFIRLSTDAPKARITHRLTNKGLWSTLR